MLIQESEQAFLNNCPSRAAMLRCQAEQMELLQSLTPQQELLLSSLQLQVTEFLSKHVGTRASEPQQATRAYNTWQVNRLSRYVSQQAQSLEETSVPMVAQSGIEQQQPATMAISLMGDHETFLQESSALHQWVQQTLEELESNNSITCSETAERNFFSAMQLLIDWLMTIDHHIGATQVLTHQQFSLYEMTGCELKMLLKCIGHLAELSDKSLGHLPEEEQSDISACLNILRTKSECLERDIGMVVQEYSRDRKTVENVEDITAVIDQSITNDMKEFTILDSSGPNELNSLEDFEKLHRKAESYRNKLDRLMLTNIQKAIWQNSSNLPELPDVAMHAQELLSETAKRTIQAKYNSRQQRWFARQFREASGLVRLAASWLESDLIFKDSDEVRVALGKHKALFANVNRALAAVKTAYNQLDPAIQCRQTSKLDELTVKIGDLYQKARVRGLHLEQAVTTWTQLQFLLQSTTRWLEENEKIVLEERSLCRNNLTECISLYKNLQANICDHQHQMSHINGLATTLHQTLRCTGPRAAVGDCNNRWDHVSVTVAATLQDLQSFWNQWQSFETDLEELSNWIADCEQKISCLKTENPGEAAIQTLMTLRGITQVQADIQSREPLRQQVEKALKLAAALRFFDEAKAQDQVSCLTKKWAMLTQDMATLESTLRNSIQSRMSVLEAVAELDQWLTTTQDSVSQTQLEDLGSFSDAQLLLSKYKSYSMEMCVNQELFQVVQKTTENYRRAEISLKEMPEDTEDFRNLEAICTRWQDVARTVAVHLKVLDTLILKWSEFDAMAESHLTWLSQVEEMATGLRAVEGATEEAVTAAIKKLQDIQKEMETKARDYHELDTMGSAVIETMKCDAVQSHVRSVLSSVECRQTAAEQMTAEVLGILIAREKQWLVYCQALKEADLFLQQAEYRVDEAGHAQSELNQCASVIQNLETVKEMMAQNGHMLRTLEFQTDGLTSVSEVGVNLELSSNLETIWLRWTSLETSVQKLLREYRQLEAVWGSLGTCLNDVAQWTVKAEITLSSIFHSSSLGHGINQHQEVEDQLKEMEQAFRNAQNQFLQVSSMALLSTRAVNFLKAELHSLSSALQHVRELLSSRRETASKERDLRVSVEEKVDSLEVFVKRTNQVILNLVDAEASRGNPLQDIQETLGSLPKYEQVTLTLKEDLLNLRESDMALLKRALESMKSWQQTCSQLIQQNCRVTSSLATPEGLGFIYQSMVNFLHRVQSTLQCSIPSEYMAVLELLGRLQAMDMESVCQRSGLKALQHGTLTQLQLLGPAEQVHIHQKLDTLEEYWKIIVLVLRQRTRLVSRLAMLWQQYLQALRHSRDWTTATQEKLNVLQDSEDNLDVEMTAVQELEKQLADDDPCSMLQACSDDLVALVDSVTATSIRSTISQVREERTELLKQLQAWKTRRKRLQTKWTELQSAITIVDELLPVLEEDAPVTYEALQEFLHSHADLKESFQKNQNQLEIMADEVSCLEAELTPSQVLQLRNQIRHSQDVVDAALHQLLVRHNLVLNRLSEWQQFGSDCDRLLQWIGSLEDCITGCGGQHLESAVQKLEKDFKLRIDNKELEYKELGEQGERLILNSNEESGRSVREHLQQLRDSWQRLNLLWSNRMSRVQHALKTMQQLESEMSALGQWLSHTEHLLSLPVIYAECNRAEIDKELRAVQELKQDVDGHGQSVKSLVVLCDSLEQECKPFITPGEQETVSQAANSLCHRWKQASRAVEERRMSIEETWKLWERFMDDFGTLETWLLRSECLARSPLSDASLHICSITQEEMEKYESLCCSVQESVVQLQSVNRQYHSLTQESRSDTSGYLRSKVLEVNARWDQLYQRVGSILRRLRHTLQTWEEFGTARELLTVWLTEMDLKLTETEHFSEEDSFSKLEHIHRLEKEFSSHAEKLHHLEQFATYVQQRSEPNDAERAELEILDVCLYWDELRIRLAQYRSRLQQQLNLKEELLEMTNTVVRPAENLYLEDEMETATAPANISEHQETIEIAAFPIETVDHASTSFAISALDDGACHSASALIIADQYSDNDSENGTGEIPENYVLHLQTVLQETEEQLEATEIALRTETPTGVESEKAPQTFARLLAACRASIDILKHLHDLSPEEGLLPACHSGAKGVIQRWEAVESEAIEKEKRIQRAQLDWAQFQAELDATETWLEEVNKQQPTWNIPDGDMGRLETTIQKHKELLLEMNRHKNKILALNASMQKYLVKSKDDLQNGNLKERLKELNNKWDATCQAVSTWQLNLQRALLQCSEFHEAVTDLITWLEMTETQMDYLTVEEAALDQNLLSIQYNKFLELKYELSKCEPRVVALERTAAQLYMPFADITSTDKEVGPIQEVQEQLQKVLAHLVALQDRCCSRVSQLQVLLGKGEEYETLETFSAEPRASCRTARSENSEDKKAEAQTSRLNRCYSYLIRVARASLPIQALMLILLGAASLLPMTEEDFSCILMNNFARSLDPMLRYPNGPPPV